MQANLVLAGRVLIKMENLFNTFYEQLEKVDIQYKLLLENHQAWKEFYIRGDRDSANKIYEQRTPIDETLNFELNLAAKTANKIIKEYKGNKKQDMYVDFAINKKIENFGSYKDFLDEVLNYSALQSDIISSEIEITMENFPKLNSLEFIIDNI